jgi:hypothetical protein
MKKTWLILIGVLILGFIAAANDSTELYNYTGRGLMYKINYSKFQATNITANYFYGNGIYLTNLSEKDPYWTGNVTVFNSSWLSTYNSTVNGSTTNYINSNNQSVVNWVTSTFVQIANLVGMVGNWTADKINYYTKTQVDDINTSQTNSVNANNQSVTNSITFNNQSVTNALATKLNINQWNATNLSYMEFKNWNSTNISYLEIKNWNATNLSYMGFKDWNATNISYALESMLNNGSYINYPWNATNESYMLISNWNATNSSYATGVYVDEQNTSQTNYILVQNGSIVNYITVVNNSVTNSIVANNNSVNSYINSNNQSITNTFNLYVLISTLVDRVGNWTLDKVNYYTTTQVDAINTSQTNYGNWQNTSVTNALNTKLGISQWNATNTSYVPYTGATANVNLGIKNLSANKITATTYLEGQPLDGGIGTGIIWANQVDATANLYITNPSGLNITYPAFKMRLITSNPVNLITYCDIPAGSVLVPDNAHTAYYIDSNCAIQHSSMVTSIVEDISPGGKGDFFNAMAHNGQIEVMQGKTIEQKVAAKLRQTIMSTQNDKVTSGFTRTTNVFPNISVSSGTYVYIRDIVTTSTLNNATIEHVGHLNATDWQFNSYYGLNLTHCDNGTAIVTCDTASYRRYYVFMVGWNGTSDKSEVHQLYANMSETYTSINCLDTITNPISYTLPPEYTYVAVPLYVYCAVRTDSSWRASNWIDLRTVKAATASITTETDPVWTADKASYITTTDATTQNTSQTNYINSNNVSVANAIVANNASVNSYISSNNQSIVNTFNLYTLISTLVDRVGNWTLDKVNYYTSTQVNTINTSVTNSITANNASMNSYVNSQNLIFNASNNNSIIAVNTTLMQIINNGSYLNYAWNATNTSYVEKAGSNMTGNLAVNQGTKLCLEWTCAHYITYNGTATIWI